MGEVEARFWETVEEQDAQALATTLDVQADASLDTLLRRCPPGTSSNATRTPSTPGSTAKPGNLTPPPPEQQPTVY
ncbi:hypothetical protein ACFQ2B_38950 [Streptomyces stramineus]